MTTESRLAQRAILILGGFVLVFVAVACAPDAAAVASERDTIQQEMDRQAGHVADLEGQLADATARLTEARDQLMATESERSNVQTLLEETVSEHEAFLATEKVLVDGLIAERDNLAGKGRDLDAKLAERQNAINAVVVERDDARAERDRLQQQVASLQQIVSDAATTIGSLRFSANRSTICYYDQTVYGFGGYYACGSGSIRCY